RAPAPRDLPPFPTRRSSDLLPWLSPPWLSLPWLPPPFLPLPFLPARGGFGALLHRLHSAHQLARTLERALPSALLRFADSLRGKIGRASCRARGNSRVGPAG